jgi:hypothetical protein
VFLQRAYEREGAGDVVIGDNQRRAEALVGPVLERPADIDANQLAEHRGVGAFEIVVRKLAQGRAYKISRWSRSGSSGNGAQPPSPRRRRKRCSR